MTTCPHCKGEKVLHCTIHESGKPPYVEDLRCVTCDGKGEVTEAVADAFAEMTAMWCECESNEDARHYHDGEHPDLYKHHWRHEPGCGKVIQIG